MWNNEKHLLWEHIAKNYYMDHGSGLLQPPKLTVDRIALKSYLKMKAILAVQVLSNTVSQLNSAIILIRRTTENLQAVLDDKRFVRLHECSTTTEYQKKWKYVLATMAADDTCGKVLDTLEFLDIFPGN